jgi:hypothetical protein
VDVSDVRAALIVAGQKQDMQDLQSWLREFCTGADKVLVVLTEVRYRTRNVWARYKLGLAINMLELVMVFACPKPPHT